MLRNIRAGLPALRGRWPVGRVIRHLVRTYIHNLEGCRAGASGAVMRVEHGHDVGKDNRYHGVPPPLLSCVRVVYIDIRKIKLCSVGGVSFHSFAWPTFDARKAKSIARSLWTNRCT